MLFRVKAGLNHTVISLWWAITLIGTLERVCADFEKAGGIELMGKLASLTGRGCAVAASAARDNIFHTHGAGISNRGSKHC